jgi:predicted ATP-grasp superfamily ATP-dependent carboligase
MNGLQTARILAKRNVPVIAIAKDPKHHCSRTNVCEKILFADTENDECIRTLETLGPELKQKAVLFPCYDENVLLVSRHRHRLEQWYHIVLPPPDVVEMMMNKTSFYTYAQANDFPIPKTFYLYGRADVEQAAQELSFPCILKPTSSASADWSNHTSVKAFKVANPADLLNLYDQYHSQTDTLVAQEWIEGSDANLYSCNCYFNASSEPVVTFVARKIRQWPPGAGDSCLGVECRDDVVLQESIRLFRSVNYYGLGYVEIKRDETSGKYFIVEPNIGRPTGRSAIAEAGGVELLYTMYCDAVGWPLPPNLEQKYGGVKWIYLRKDFQSAFYYWRRGDLTLKEWWRSWRGRKAYALFSWRDPAPFLGDLLKAMRNFFSPQTRRKRNFRNPLSVKKLDNSKTSVSG